MSNYPLIVISGPSGAGKSSLANLLLKNKDIARCVTCTTRKPRSLEVDGEDYYFLDEKTFESHMRKGDFLEYSYHYGNGYGVRKSDIERILKTSPALITLNWEGAKVLEKKLDHVYVIYVEPPSKEILKKRLEDRGSDGRFVYAETDLKHAGLFKHRIINDDLEKAYEKLEKMIEPWLLGNSEE